MTLLFCSGTQYADWQGANCDRCTKGNGDDLPTCPLALAIFEEYSGFGEVSTELRERIKPQSDRYNWPCGEWEASEEWKAEFERRMEKQCQS